MLSVSRFREIRSVLQGHWRISGQRISTAVLEKLNYVWGCRTDSTLPDRFDVIEPATGKTLTTGGVSGAQDVSNAVSAALKGFEDWSQRSGSERSNVLYTAAKLLENRVDEIAEIETRDCGKPIWEAKGDILFAAESLAFFAGLAGNLHGDHFQLAGGSFAYTRREPLGVCAGIGAWNYPLQTACWKMAPALASGNAMVYKPSPLAPLSAVVLGEILTEAGVPPGVFNVVQGNADTGWLLSSHPDVAKVSFTGSVATGKKVMEAASSGVKPVTLELGGKSPLIVFEDANLDNAVSGALIANYTSQGECCSNGTRVFVQSKIKEEFLDKAVARTRNLKVGDPLVIDTQLGAVISAAHRDRIINYVESARKDGARVLCGGDAFIPSDAQLSGGFYVSPCIIDKCTDDMKAVCEEIFGPVMCVLDFDTEDEALSRANNTDYGLAAGVFTKDIQQAHRVIAGLQAGMCWINTYNMQPVQIPFGGYKQSGFGRESGEVALTYYSQLKTVYVEMGNVQSPY